MLTLTLLTSLALAQEAAVDPAAETDAAAPAEEVAEAPPAEASAPEQPAAPSEPAPPVGDTLVWSSDPLGQGDDRIARQIEGLVGARQDTLLACREGHDDAGRILSAQIKLNLDGTVKWAKARLPTGDGAVDACALGVLSGLVLDPTPMFADKMRVNLRWAPPGDDPGL